MCDVFDDRELLLTQEWIDPLFVQTCIWEQLILPAIRQLVLYEQAFRQLQARVDKKHKEAPPPMICFGAPYSELGVLERSIRSERLEGLYIRLFAQENPNLSYSKDWGTFQRVLRSYKSLLADRTKLTRSILLQPPLSTLESRQKAFGASIRESFRTNSVVFHGDLSKTFHWARMNILRKHVEFLSTLDKNHHTLLLLPVHVQQWMRETKIRTFEQTEEIEPQNDSFLLLAIEHECQLGNAKYFRDLLPVVVDVLRELLDAWVGAWETWWKYTRPLEKQLWMHLNHPSLGSGEEEKEDGMLKKDVEANEKDLESKPLDTSIWTNRAFVSLLHANKDARMLRVLQSCIEWWTDGYMYGCHLGVLQPIGPMRVQFSWIKRCLCESSHWFEDVTEHTYTPDEHMQRILRFQEDIEALETQKRLTSSLREWLARIVYFILLQ